MPRVFISYSSKDCQQISMSVAKVVEEAVGYQVWLDQKNIEIGEEWEPALSTGLEAADWFLLLASRGAARSNWVRRETSWAISHLPGRILPIVVDGTEPALIDPRLATVQHLDYHKDKLKTSRRLARLLREPRSDRFGRGIVGDWISAVQPVYYRRPKWHVQNVMISASSGIYLLKTVPAPNKLQWRMDGELVADAFLAGPWRSTREGSLSHGYMTLQLSRNGSYMCGHDYAVAQEEGKAHFGAMLLGRTTSDLRRAWLAVTTMQRDLLPLSKRCDFGAPAQRSRAALERGHGRS